MTALTVPTFTATIYVGLKVRYDGNVVDKALALAAIQKYTDLVGLCVTVTDTKYVYSNGGEPGLIVGLINYPRFPSSVEQIKAHALVIAELLLKVCQQMKVTVVMPNETVMLSAPEGVAQ